MNDRFKFRFWDKETKTMQKIPMIELNHRITLDKIFADDRVIFMQCTGMKDKNGKLIYEGDVIKRANAMNQQYIIAWNDKGFWSASEHALSFCVETIMKDYEVIGNIYENPELLESEE